MLRYLNMFILIGVALIIVSLAGFATGGKFLMEPGQPLDPMASIVYLGAGVLMVFNGVLSVKTAPVHTAPPAAEPKSSDTTEQNA
jgi:hypothetical protein